MPQPNPPFSRRSFILKQLLMQAVLQLSVKLLFPDYWIHQWTCGWGTSIKSFVYLHAGVALFEYSLHRWSLHKVFLKLLAGLFQAHKIHHDLTDIYLDIKEGKVVSHYPIETEEQNESSSFPWWVVIVVWGLGTVVLAYPQYIFQNIPIFSMGSLAFTFSNMGYELFHAEFHRPYKDWEQRTERSKYRTIWKWVYGGHLLHHANRLCNLWVFGFFGLPLWDWLFGTLVIPKKLLLHNRTATAEDFPKPKPRRFILAIDGWVAKRQRLIMPPPKRTAA